MTIARTSCFAILIVPALAFAHASMTLRGIDTTASGDDYSVRWQVSTPTSPVTVRVSSDPAARPASMRIVSRTKGSGSATFTAPLGAGVRPYFWVESGKEGQRTATRLVPLEGVSNFRDLGGYATGDGKHVVWGRLFRSNALAELTAADYRTVDALGVRTVCDLRTDAERTKQPTHWQGTPPTFVTSPKPEIDSVMKSLFTHDTTTGAAAHDAMVALYRRLPEMYAGELRTLFARLIAGEAPLVLHCTAGKDRSGLASALLLTALGVDREQVLADYALSQPFISAGHVHHPPSVGLKANAASYSSLPPDVVKAIDASDPDYLRAALAEIEARWGSIDAYLDKVLGVGASERATMRRRYLE